MPKALEVRILFQNLANELKGRLDKQILFLLKCVENFCQNLGSGELPLKKFEGVSKFLDHLGKLQRVRSSRMGKILKTKSQKYGSRSTVNTLSNPSEEGEFKKLKSLFPKFWEAREEYLRDSRTLRENDVVDLLSKWNIHDELFLDNHTLKWCLDYLVEEKTHWEQDLQCLNLIATDLFKVLVEEYTSMLRIKFHRKQKQRHSKFVTESTILVESFQERTQAKAKSTKSGLHQYAKKLFGKYPFPIKNQTLLETVSWAPLLVQSTVKKRPKSEPSLQRRMSSFNRIVDLESLYSSKVEKKVDSKHLVVLLHGQDGHHKNMNLYRRFIGMILPRAVCLSAKSLSNKKAACIRELAKDLTNEIVFMLKKHGDIGHISFICHNLGGLVARAALPYLASYRSCMHSFVSLGTPHLGKGLADSFFSKSKFFFWETSATSSIRDQLEMKDSEDPRDSFLYQLAKNDCLHWFENLILVDSKEHIEVDTESAHLQLWTQGLDPSKQELVKEMTQFIWGATENEAIVRVDVNLENPER